jgi:hypothetical protein
MHRERHHQGDIGATGAKHAGHVQYGFHPGNVELRQHRAFVAVLQHIIVQPRLPVPDQPRQRDRCVHIRQRVMRVRVSDAIGAREILEAETGQTILTQRPLNAFRTQGAGCAHHIDDVPAGIAVLPLSRVGIKEIAIQGMARNFVVKAQ